VKPKKESVKGWPSKKKAIGGRRDKKERTNTVERKGIPGLGKKGG